MGCHVYIWVSKCVIFPAVSCQLGVTLIPSVSHCMEQEQHYKGALPNPRWAEPHSPFALGPSLPSTAGSWAYPSAPTSPQRALAWCVSLPPLCEVPSQSPPLKADYALCCINVHIARESAAVRVSYLLGMCQKPQVFLRQELGVATQLKTTMSATDFIVN